MGSVAADRSHFDVLEVPPHTTDTLTSTSPCTFHDGIGSVQVKEWAGRDFQKDGAKKKKKGNFRGITASTDPPPPFLPGEKFC